MRGTVQERSRREKGQSLVELALLLPVLLIILLGAIDFGRIFYTHIVMINASREGALYGARNPTDSDGIKAHVLQETVGTVSIDPGRITITCDTLVCTPGSQSITVTVEADFQILVPAPFLPYGGTIPLIAHTTMPVL